VFTDMAVAIADGADCVSHIEVFGDRGGMCGPVASMPTTWRMLDRIDDAHLPGVVAARAAARERAWAAGAAPDLTGLLQIDFDATITISHSEEKENAAKTWKRTFGFHPLLAFLDRREVSGGEALGCLLRPGNAGSNTAADHITVRAADQAQEDLRAALNVSQPATRGDMRYQRGQRAGQVRSGQARDTEPRDGAALHARRQRVDQQQADLRGAVRVTAGQLPPGGVHGHREELNLQRHSDRPRPDGIVGLRNPGNAGPDRTSSDEDDRSAGVDGERAVEPRGRHTQEHHVAGHDAGKGTAEAKEADRVCRAAV
jgi:hypothetical protein